MIKEAGVRATIAYLARAPGSRKEHKDDTRPYLQSIRSTCPDTPGPGRSGHGVIVFTTANDPENALIQAPLHIMNPRVRDNFDWCNAEAYECKHVGTRMKKDGHVIFSFEI